MTNLVLFFCSLGVWFLICHYISKTTLKTSLKRLLILIPLCAPFNVNNNIYTILGNAESEKNIYSFTSFYQKAKGNAFSVLNVLSLKISDTYATSLFSAVSYSTAKIESKVYVNLLSKQKSDAKAYTFIGILSSQSAPQAVETNLGFCIYQESKKCFTPATLTLLQKEDGEIKCFVAFTSH